MNVSLSFLQKGTIQKEIYNPAMEAWISLDSSNLLCSVLTFNKLILLKKLRASSHS